MSCIKILSADLIVKFRPNFVLNILRSYDKITATVSIRHVFTASKYRRVNTCTLKKHRNYSFRHTSSMYTSSSQSDRRNPTGPTKSDLARLSNAADRPRRTPATLALEELLNKSVAAAYSRCSQLISSTAPIGGFGC